jgi:hypothetical protein
MKDISFTFISFTFGGYNLKKLIPFISFFSYFFIEHKKFQFMIKNYLIIVFLYRRNAEKE